MTAGAAPAGFPSPPVFVPYRELGERPNVIVDGAPLRSTVLTLSHWPNNATPPELKRDTSTATAFAYLETAARHQDVPFVSNSHFDEDGLFSMFTLCNPQIAMRHRRLLIDASEAGDFGVFDSRDAARLCFAVESFASPEQSPLPADIFAGCERARTARLYPAMLAVLPELLADLPRFRPLWAAQDQHLDESLRWIESGRVTIREFPELDLAIVEIPDDLPVRTVRRYLAAESVPVHPFAIHRATGCNRLLRIQGERYELQYRYDSWVQLATRRPLLRASLEDLAAQLNARETAPGTWRGEPVTDVVPRLYLDGTDASGIPRDEFLDQVAAYLRTAPVAWDPYDWHGD